MNNKFEDMYFHGLAGNIIVMNSESLVIDTSLMQLENIFSIGGIYSRNKLKEHNIEYFHKGVINGDNYISVCVMNPSEDEFKGYNEGFESSYVNYVQFNKIALIIDKNIESKCEFRSNEGIYMLPGERQIKDGVSLDDIVGISVMFENELFTNEAASRINDLLQRYNLSIPLYDKHFNQIEVENIHSL